MNRPSSAFGLLLGFLALTMFAVSSTSRSTSIKPAAGHADRALLRRQAAWARLNVIEATSQSLAACDSLDGEDLCTPHSFESDPPAAIQIAEMNAEQNLQSLEGSATIRLTPVQLQFTAEGLESQVLAQLDGRTDYDPVYDRVVLGFIEAALPAPSIRGWEDNRELSAAEVAMVFRSVLPEKSATTRSATSKPHRRASLEGVHTVPDALIRAL